LAWWQTEQVPAKSARPAAIWSCGVSVPLAAAWVAVATALRLGCGAVAEVDRVEFLAGVDALVLRAVDLEDGQRALVEARKME
jgi:hypothetical protein